jgi:hypothetical protein
MNINIQEEEDYVRVSSDNDFYYKYANEDRWIKCDYKYHEVDIEKRENILIALSDIHQSVQEIVGDERGDDIFIELPEFIKDNIGEELLYIDVIRKHDCERIERLEEPAESITIEEPIKGAMYEIIFSYTEEKTTIQIPYDCNYLDLSEHIDRYIIEVPDGVEDGVLYLENISNRYIISRLLEDNEIIVDPIISRSFSITDLKNYTPDLYVQPKGFSPVSIENVESTRVDITDKIEPLDDITIDSPIDVEVIRSVKKNEDNYMFNYTETYFETDENIIRDCPEGVDLELILTNGSRKIKKKINTANCESISLLDGNSIEVYIDLYIDTENPVRVEVDGEVYHYEPGTILSVKGRIGETVTVISKDSKKELTVEPTDSNIHLEI